MNSNCTGNGLESGMKLIALIWSIIGSKSEMIGSNLIKRVRNNAIKHVCSFDRLMAII